MGTVKRALVGQQEQQKNTIDCALQNKEEIDFLDDLQKDNVKTEKASRFIILHDCLTNDDLDDQNEYKNIYDDMRAMFEQYGLVLQLRIPRRGEKGYGKVVIEYDNLPQATAAKNGVQGKLFGGKPVIAKFIEEIDVKLD